MATSFCCRQSEGKTISGSTNASLTLVTKEECEKGRGESSPLIHTFSSLLASGTSTAAFYPFDTIRVRFMSQDGTVHRQHNGQTYSSVAKAFATVYREEGVRAFFRGCHVAVLGSVTAWGIYMFLYRSLCNVLDASSSYLGCASASFLASLVASFLSSPIWLIKSRIQIEGLNKAKNYVNFRTGMRHMLHTSGFLSLWRGVSLHLALILPNSLNMPTYDFLKSVLLRRRIGESPADGELSVMETSLCSSLTKTLLILVSHPIMVLKVRLQDQRWNAGEVKYSNIRHSVRYILRREGMRGMLRGLGASLLHSLPRSAAYFVLYEKSLGFMRRCV